MQRFLKISSLSSSKPIRRWLVTTSVQKSNSVKTGKTVKRGAKGEFDEYIKNLPIFKQNPKHIWATNYLRIKRRSQSSLYLVEDEVADKIVTTIKRRHTLNANATVIEINPGFGLLTSRLTNKLGFSHVNCFEDDAQLGTRLVEEYGVNLIPSNFISLPRTHHADKLDGETRVANIFSKVHRGTSDLYIFGATGTSSLLNFVIRTLVTQRVLFEEDFDWKGISFYLSLGSRTTAIFTSTPESLYTLYRPASILFQLLFQHEILGVLPRKAYLPWETRNTAYELQDSSEKYRRLRIQSDPDQMFLVHFRPHFDVIEKIGRDNLIILWYFIRHNGHSRKNPVIPQLEQWIPGCGPRLILQGFTIYTQFGSLTPSQILDLYYQFVSWPEYPSSSFLTAVEKFHSKLDSTEVDVLDFPKPT